MFDLEREAWHYVRNLPYPQTATQMKAYVSDWLTKDRQVEVGLSFFDRDVGIDVAGKRLLEFGCGAGAMCFAFADRGARVLGVDVDAQVIDIARRWGASRGSVCEFVHIDHTLPFPDGSFDVIYSSSTFEHVAWPEQALRELDRVLAPDGVVYLAFPNRLWPTEGHTDLLGLPWLPRRLAGAYLALRIPGWTLNSLWFYGLPGFRRVLRRSGARLRLVCPRVPEKGLRGWVKRAMHRAGVPYSAVTPSLALVLRH